MNMFDIRDQEMEELLTDQAFVNYFNTFLSLPAFHTNLMYHPLQGCFTDMNGRWPRDPLTKKKYSISEVFNWVATERLEQFFYSQLCADYVLATLIVADSDKLSERFPFHEEILGTAEGSVKFQSFLHGHAGLNNLILWKDLECYRQCGKAKKRMEMEALFRERYILVGAPMECPLEIKRSMYECLKKPNSRSRNCFVSVQETLLEKLRNYWYPRFLLSPLFRWPKDYYNDNNDDDGLFPHGEQFQLDYCVRNSDEKIDENSNVRSRPKTVGITIKDNSLKNCDADDNNRAANGYMPHQKKRPFTAPFEIDHICEKKDLPLEGEVTARSVRFSSNNSLATNSRPVSRPVSHRSGTDIGSRPASRPGTGTSSSSKTILYRKLRDGGDSRPLNFYNLWKEPPVPPVRCTSECNATPLYLRTLTSASLPSSSCAASYVGPHQLIDNSYDKEEMEFPENFSTCMEQIETSRDNSFVNVLQSDRIAGSPLRFYLRNLTVNGIAYFVRMYDFWWAVQEYKHVVDRNMDIVRAARNIYQIYLGEGSRMDIGLDNESRAAVTYAMSAPTQNIFDQIQWDVYNELRYIWKGYVRSERPMLKSTTNKPHSAAPSIRSYYEIIPASLTRPLCVGPTAPLLPNENILMVDDNDEEKKLWRANKRDMRLEDHAGMENTQEMDVTNPAIVDPNSDLFRALIIAERIKLYRMRPGTVSDFDEDEFHEVRQTTDDTKTKNTASIKKKKRTSVDKGKKHSKSTDSYMDRTSPSPLPPSESVSVAPINDKPKVTDNHNRNDAIQVKKKQQRLNKELHNREENSMLNSFEEMLLKKREKKIFRGYLKENGKESMLTLWYAIESYNKISPDKKYERAISMGEFSASTASSIFENYLAPSVVGKLDLSSDITVSLPECGGKPSAMLLNSCQLQILNILKTEYYPAFTETAEYRVSKTNGKVTCLFQDMANLGQVGKSHVATRHAVAAYRKDGGTKRAIKLFAVYAREVLLCVKGLLNPVTADLFIQFLVQVGTQLEYELIFWLEARLYHKLVSSSISGALSVAARNKVKFIISTYMAGPPETRTSVPPEIAAHIFERADHLKPSLFLSAQHHIFLKLFVLWGPFCEWRLNKCGDLKNRLKNIITQIRKAGASRRQRTGDLGEIFSNIMAADVVSMAEAAKLIKDSRRDDCRRGLFGPAIERPPLGVVKFSLLDGNADSSDADDIHESKGLERTHHKGSEKRKGAAKRNTSSRFHLNIAVLEDKELTISHHFVSPLPAICDDSSELGYTTNPRRSSIQEHGIEGRKGRSQQVIHSLNNKVTRAQRLRDKKKGNDGISAVGHYQQSLKSVSTDHKRTPDRHYGSTKMGHSSGGGHRFHENAVLKSENNKSISTPPGPGFVAIAIEPPTRSERRLRRYLK